MSAISVSRRAWLAVLATLGALSLFPVATAWNTAPVAKAESGRRLCIYVEDDDQHSASVTALKAPGTGTQPVSYTAKVPSRLTVALDYKRDGACPGLSSLRLGGENIQLSYSASGTQPKFDCENIYIAGGITGHYRGPSLAEVTQSYNPSLGLVVNQQEGTDVCTKMDDDILYAFWAFQQPVNLDLGGGKSVRAVKGDFVTTRLWAPSS